MVNEFPEQCRTEQWRLIIQSYTRLKLLYYVNSAVKMKKMGGIND